MMFLESYTTLVTSNTIAHACLLSVASIEMSEIFFHLAELNLSHHVVSYYSDEATMICF